MQSQKEPKGSKAPVLLKPIPVRLTRDTRKAVEKAASEDQEPNLSSEIRYLVRLGLERRERIQRDEKEPA